MATKFYATLLYNCNGQHVSAEVQSDIIVPKKKGIM
jgi:hypothetical protein